jgi:hypothetical protein
MHAGALRGPDRTCSHLKLIDNQIRLLTDNHPSRPVTTRTNTILCTLANHIALSSGVQSRVLTSRFPTNRALEMSRRAPIDESKREGLKTPLQKTFALVVYFIDNEARRSLTMSEKTIEDVCFVNGRTATGIKNGDKGQHWNV